MGIFNRHHWSYSLEYGFFFFFLEDYRSQEWKSLSFYQIVTAGSAQPIEFRNPHVLARSCLIHVAPQRVACERSRAHGGRPIGPGARVHGGLHPLPLLTPELPFIRFIHPRHDVHVFIHCAIHLATNAPRG